ncbi:MAG: MbnP family copper-binding protein [Polyangiales bacterium]
MKRLEIMLGALCVASVASVGCSDDGGDGTQEVTIRFAGVVGTEPFVCGETYDNLGADDSSLEISDFRFYVQSVELKNQSGDYVPVVLAENDWQAEGATLIDFEDGCTDLGTEPMNETVTGTVPAGSYEGIRFEMGVPFEANHDNPSTAPSPLNLTSMHWDWQGGYKFLRIDSGTFSMTDWRMHLGSTGCDGDPISGGTTACSAPNRTKVELESFAPESDTLIADLAALVEGAALDENQTGTPVGCMAGPADSDCAPLFNNLGLPFAGNPPSGPQIFFSVD